MLFLLNCLNLNCFTIINNTGINIILVKFCSLIFLCLGDNFPEVACLGQKWWLFLGLGTHIALQEDVLVTPPPAEKRQLFSLVVYKGAQPWGILDLQNFERCSTNVDGKGMRCHEFMPVPQICLPCLGRTSPFFHLIYVRMNYHTLTGPFGLLGGPSSWPVLSVSLFYSMHTGWITKDYIVF